MDNEEIKKAIVTNVYHIKQGQNVALHRHRNHDEVFYCIRGSGFGVLENGEEAMSVAKAFIVKAGTMHALRTDGDLHVVSFLIPVVKEETANL
ncbi:MAG: cupin domain-containing protein [candidate division Zixibacteria bacterium]|nr:cupin domain-containing protein [candidate division Zixibacteria bacterium]